MFHFIRDIKFDSRFVENGQKTNGKSMMSKWRSFVLLLFLIPVWVYGQEWVQLNGVRFVPEPNIAVRGRQASLDITKEQAVLVQFRELPSEREVAAWEAKGGKLLGYLGANAYYAVLPQQLQASKNLRSVMPLKPEWKVSPAFQNRELTALLSGAEGRIRATLWYSPVVSTTEVKEALHKAGAQVVSLSELFGTCTLEIAEQNIAKLATLPWVLTITPAEPPLEANNYTARALGRASVLNTPTTLGGRGLTGKDIRIGIWDGNVVWHPDFGNRIHTQEYEVHGANARHGTHVAGSVLSAGVIDPLGTGMAPQAEAYTWNFNVGSNGLSQQQEMAITRDKYGITLTQNSYGVYISGRCLSFRSIINYSSDYELDRLTFIEPTLTHVFAAGNDQQGCPTQSEEVWGVPNYGLAPRRAKNVINIAAVDDDGSMTSFSSFGPQDDGRVFPTVAAKGYQVLSTEALGYYYRENGTSMACPVATGHLALLQERFKQIYCGQEIRNDLLRALVANTADDAGRKGVDFQYGYGILNAEHALNSIENNWWIQANVQNAQKQSHRVSIPAATKSLRVMLAWNDPATAKAREYGEPALINNLDLVLKINGKSYNPWVLNTEKGKVEELPTRKIDVLNNMEQVTLDMSEIGAATEMELFVEGKKVVDGAQEYVLTWWFEKESDALRIVWPSAGSVVEAELSYLIYLEGVKGKFHVDLTLDGGKSYKRLLEGSDITEEFALPKNVTVTDQAQLRLVEEATGRTFTTERFTVSPKIRNVALKSSTCGYENWELTWDANVGAVNGYTVLLNNPDTQQWDIVAEDITSASITSWAIPADIAKRYSRPIFTVAPRLAKGKYGQRAKAVQAQVSVPLPQTIELPYTETFVRTPSPFLKIVEVGKHIHHYYATRSFADGAVAGSNVFACKVTSTRKGTLADAEYFDKAKNADNMAEFQICSIDLTTKGDVRFVIEGALIDAEKIGSARFVLEDNGVALPSQYAHADNVQSTHPDYTQWYFTLKGGMVHQLKLKFAGLKEGDSFAITRILLAPFANDVDLTLQEVERPVNKSRMGKETLKVRILNRSDAEAKNLELRAFVNGELQASSKVETLAARAQTDVSFILDLSTQYELGEKKQIRFELLCAEDQELQNNILETTVLNYGKVVALEKTEVRNVPLLGQTKRDPRLTMHLKVPVIFTDNGGVLDNYADGQQSTMKFLPPDPSLRVRITFNEFHTKAHEAALAIYTTDVPSDLNIRNTRIRALLTGNITDMPLQFVSEAKDGGLTVHFISLDGADLASGWLAKVDYVPVANAVTLVSAQGTKLGSDDQGQVTVSAKVLNRFEKPLENVGLYVWNGSNTYYLRMRDVTLQPGINELVFPETVAVPFANSTVVKMYIESEDDYDASDNDLDVLLAYDRYCFTGGIANTQRLNLASLQIGARKYGFPANPGRLMYMSKDGIFDIHKLDKTVKAQFFFDLNETEGLENALAVWVDWNDNGLFDEDEKTAVAVSDYDYSKILTLNIPETATEGKKRMRIILGDKESVDRGACSSEGLVYGDMRDVFLNVIAGADPTIGDIELVEIDAGKSGHDRSAAQEVKIKLKNLSSTAFKGKVTAKLFVDGAEKATQEFDFSRNALYAYSGQRTMTFTEKVDLSAVGKHTIKVEIDEAGGEATKANNVKEVEIVCVKDATDAFKAIRLLGYTHEGTNPSKREYINMKELGQEMGRPVDGKECFIEMVVKMDKPQNAFFLRADNVTLRAAYGLEATTGVADGSLVFLIGDKLLLSTKKPVLTPGVWQHIGVAVYNIEESEGSFKGSCDVDLYVDGKKVEVEKDGAEVPIFRNLQLCRRFDGQIALFRVTKKAPKNADVVKVDEEKFAYTLEKTDQIAEYRFNEGQNAKNVYSRAKKEQEVYMADFMLPDADLLNATGEKAVWQDIPKDKLFHTVRLKHQIGDWKWDETNKQFVVTFPKELEAEALKTLTIDEVKTLWSNATYEFNGVAVSTLIGSVCDLSEAKHVTLKATVTVFGHTITETVKLVARIDESAQFAPLALKLAKEANNGLNADIIIPVADQMLVTVNESTGIPTDLSKLVLDVTLPEGAKAFYKGTQCQSRVTNLDLRESAFIITEAANGTQHVYELKLAIEQKIENWATEQLTYTYGSEVEDANSPLRATATSQLPVTYLSSNPQVASVANGKLKIAKVGETMLRAVQNGNNLYKATESAERKVVVTPKPITVTLNQKVAFGEKIDWEFLYDGLVAASDTYRMPSPWNKSAYTLKNSQGVAVAHDGLLNCGVYKLEVKTPSYTTDEYTITVQEGTLEVLPSEEKVAVEFVVKDENGQPIEGVRVATNDVYRTTNAEGYLLLSFAKGENLTWKAEKVSYSTERGAVVLTSNKRFDLTLKKATVVLKYAVHTATPNGVIVGDLEQHLAVGATGTLVRAIPASGYAFDEWSDGKKEATRIDANVTESKTYTAKFRPQRFLLQYTLGEGGKWKTGSEALAKQEVDAGKDATPVEVEPASADYYFIKWSDGNLGARREDKNILADATLVAEFGKYADLPQTNDFEEKVFTKGWYVLSEGAARGAFRITNRPQKNDNEDKGIDGYFAAATSYGVMEQVNTTLYTTRYKLASAQGKDIAVKFDYFFPLRSAVNGTKAKIEYSFDGTTWVKATDINPFFFGATVVSKEVKIEQATYAANEWIQFRWNYFALNDYSLSLDNIAVYAKDAAQQYSVSYVAQPAEAGEFVDENNQSVASPVMVIAGTTPAPIYAKAKDGWKFVKWLETGSTDKELSISVPVVQNSTYTAQFRSLSKLRISYKAILAEGGKFTVNGVEGTEQEVLSGADALPIVAVPNAGYRFVRWENGSTQAERLIKNVTADMELVATFVKIEHTVRFTVTSDGVPVAGALVQLGRDVLRTDAEGKVAVMLPQGTYRYEVIADGYQHLANSLEVTDHDLNLVLDLKTQQLQNCVTVTLTVLGAKTQPVEEAEVTIGTFPMQKTNAEGKVVFTLEANKTHSVRIVAATYAEKQLELTVGATDLAQEVQLDRVQYTVTFSAEAGGALKALVGGAEFVSGGNVAHDEELVINVQSEANYTLATFVVNGNDKFAEVHDNQFKVRVTEQLTIAATFKSVLKTYAVTLTHEGEGTLKVTGIEEAKLNAIPEGTELTAVATPKTGWKLKSLTAGTQDISADGKFTVIANVEVKAVFEKITPVEDAMFANVVVSPNPFENQLRITSNDLRGQYALLNAQGVVVRRGNMDGNKVVIETSDLTSGLYLLRLTAESGATKTITVVKER